MTRTDASASPSGKRRVAIVTGGAQGIGAQICRTLVASGHSVALFDLDRDGAERTAAAIAGPDVCRAHAVDVSDERATAEAVAAVEAQLGPVDVLVNNAALFSALARKPFEDIGIDEWNRVMAVNVGGPFLMAKAVAPRMRARRHGRIVNISSNTVQLGRPNFLHYVTSKAAIVGMTRSLARELGADGVTVNALMPSLTRTGVPTQVVAESTFEEIARLQCIPRTGLPSDVADAVAFLASDAAGFITGQTIAVDGGAVFL